MIKEKLEILCHKLDFGCIRNQPQKVLGGLLHEMVKIETTKGLYAVKVLNPSIMKRKDVIRNYIFSEKVAKIAYLYDIPVVPALGSDSCLHFIDGSYFMVFEWVEAKSLTPAQVTPYHCEEIGKILARIHKINFSSIEEKNMGMTAFDGFPWDDYFGFKNMSSIALLKVKERIYHWEKEVKLVSDDVFSNQIISHRDMDCKNVLWDKKNRPIIIDWEAAGFINPLQELIDVAIAWSDGETEDFKLQHFIKVVESYIANGGSIIDDIFAVLSYGYKGKLEWLEYNVKRSLGIESNCIDEQELGTKEVIKTINALINYENLIPICVDILNNYKTTRP